MNEIAVDTYNEHNAKNTLDKTVINDTTIKRTKYKKKVMSVFTYTDYITNNITLTTYTMPILKQVCKSYKLCISGRKREVIDRLTRYFHRIKNAIIIQKYTRRHMIQMFIRKQKENNKLIGQCVNDTDFSTLDPLNSLSPSYLYCYTDTDNFTYGFNIASLIELIRNTPKLLNPYNRREISNMQRNNIISVYNITTLIDPSFKESNLYYHTYSRVVPHTPRRAAVNNVIERNVNIENSVNREFNIHSTVSSYNNYHPFTNITNETAHRQYQRIERIRNETVDTRITQLFIEIDQLGNYTQSSWFNELSHLQYARLYRALYDIWAYRGQISLTLKLQICPFHGPFEGIFHVTVRHLDLSIDDLKRACLIVFENMVYSGIDDDARKIGCIHALSALTIVSYSARAALPWLFESIAF